ncbi:REP-associated tyrosine transposase [Candidatus Viridilinea mediisalina]|nr:transposase [Candidatus Viridilinea mediisalina]
MLSPDEQRAIVAERLDRGFPPHRPPHLEQGQGYYLLTATIYQHHAIMLSETRLSLFEQALLEAFEQPGITCCAWVVLPNHYHLLVQLPALAVVSAILKRLHGRTARQWNIEDNTIGRKVWYYYSDRAIRDEQHFYRATNYLHANAVRHRYAKHSLDWRFSSLHRYIADLGMDWVKKIEQDYPFDTFGDGWDAA